MFPSGLRVGAAVAGVLLLAACGAAAPVRGAPPAKAEKLKFPSLEMAEDGAPLMVDGYLFRPAAEGPRPAVVLLHGCGGLIGRSGRLNTREVDWARRLAAAGYAVLAVDSFGARGVKSMCAPADYQASIFQARPKDAYGALLYLQRQDFVRPDRIGVIGWSQGGGVLLVSIRERDSLGRPAALPQGDFRAAVAFYPGVCAKRKLKPGWATRIPFLVLAGEADVWTPAAPCRELIEGAAAAGSPAAIHTYPGAYHDFDWPGMPVREVPAFRTTAGVVPITGMQPEAREDALARVPAFLARFLGE